MSKLPKKLIISFLLFVFAFQFLAPLSPVQAQGAGGAAVGAGIGAIVGALSPTRTWYAPGFGEWYLKTFDTSNPNEIFGERYTAAQVQWVVWSLPSVFLNQLFGPELGTCIIKNFTPTSLADGINKLTTYSETKGVLECGWPLVRRLNDILIASTGPSQNSSLLATILGRRDISAISYFSDLGNRVLRFHLIPEAQAQTAGFGFNALLPILDIWKAVRNVSYSLLIIVVVVFAFLIMFRVKLNPQTAVTIQSALPKIVLTIILITFSYAIAGLLVDLMYVVYGILAIVVKQIMPQFSFSIGASVGGASFSVGLASWSITQAFNLMVGVGGANIFAAITFIMLSGGLVVFLISLPLAAITAPTGILPLVFIGIGLVTIVICIFSIVKIFWGLLKAYAMVILLTIGAPLYLLLGALVPSFNFGSWLRSFISNLAVFVTTSLLLTLSIVFGLIAVRTVFSPSSGAAAIGSAGWPPLLGIGGSLMTGGLIGAVGLVLLFIAPKATQLVQSIIKGQPFAYGAAIGEVFAPGITVGRFGLGAVAAKTEAANIKLAKQQGLPEVPREWWVQGLRSLGVIK